MPINASPEFLKAQGEYTLAKTKEEKLRALEKLIRLAPKHKGSENLLADLKARLAKLKKEIEETKKKKKHALSLFTIKKTGSALVVLVGLTNVGKSALLSALTNATPKISPFPYTTTKPEQGTLDYDGCKIQLVEVPSLKQDIESDASQLGLIRTADLSIIVATNAEEAEKIIEEFKRANISTPYLIVQNKYDSIQKIFPSAEIFVSAEKHINIEDLKRKIFSKLHLIRIFTKEPGKEMESNPVILKEGASIKELTEKIHKSFLEKFNYALILGKSAKYPWQRCGLNHILQDGDIVEIYLKK